MKSRKTSEKPRSLEPAKGSGRLFTSVITTSGSFKTTAWLSIISIHSFSEVSSMGSRPRVVVLEDESESISTGLCESSRSIQSIKSKNGHR